MRNAALRTVRTIAVASLALVAVAIVAGCGRPKETPPDAVYTVRGEVVAVAPPPGGEVTLHHEAVPAFKDRQGKPSPMGSMTMGFPPAPGVDTSKLHRGDKVELTFELRWEGNPPARAIRIVPLPAATELDFAGGAPHLEPVAPLGPGAPAITPDPSFFAPEPAATPPLA